MWPSERTHVVVEKNTEGLWVILAVASAASLSPWETDGNCKVAQKLAGGMAAVTKQQEGNEMIER